MNNFKTYDEFSKYLNGLGMFHMDLGLGRMLAFLDAWGQKPTYPIIHVVGTNGKGSTSAFLSEIAMAHGLSVGLYTSPHFISVRERIFVNNKPLSQDEWTALANKTLAMGRDIGLTYFELLTCMAALGFEERGIDLAVMEAGMGGRYDATNVFRPQITLFTPIGLDHEAILGDTVAKIAADKAGAMRLGGVAITGPQTDEVMEVLRARSNEVGSDLLMADEIVPDDEPLEVGMAGIHQPVNARLALAGWRIFSRELGIEEDADGVSKALKRAFVPGRMQIVPGEPQLILDGAHNAHALEVLKRSLDQAGIRPGTVIFACMKDKPLERMLPILRELSTGPVIVPGISGCVRSMPPGELAALIGAKARPVTDMGAALEVAASGKGPILVCGSLYLLADFYNLYPNFLRS